MPLPFVLDENLRGRFWRAIQGHNARSPFPVDVVRVGDPADLPRRSLDPDILLWAEREGRILVTLDKNTMPGHLTAHLAAGHHSPGILMIRPGFTIRELVFHLALIAYACQPDEYADQYVYMP